MAARNQQNLFLSCLLAYILGPVLTVWGLSVLVLSLVTLFITTSYRGVFPFGAPLWTGTLFLIIGCYLLFTHKASQHLEKSKRSHVWLTLWLAILATCESLVALGLSLWHYLELSPSLSLCTPDPYLSSGAGQMCECTQGFINPPSLIRTVYRFEAVSDCKSLGTSLQTFYHVLTGLYGLGVLLAVLLCVGAIKCLYSLGTCGEFGVYTITPAASQRSTLREGPVSPHTGPHRAPVGTAHQFVTRPPLNTPPRLVSGSSRHRLASTGSTYQSAMI